jgi:hypothetical protein
VKRFVSAIPLLPLAVMLSGCGDLLPSEYHGTWQCGPTVFVITGKSVTHTTRSKSVFSTGDWTASIEKVVNYGDEKAVTLSGGGMGMLLLRRDGSSISVDGGRCSAG